MRRRLTAVAVAALVAVFGFTVYAEAGLRVTAQHRYMQCKRKFKAQHARPCGRNIVALGWKEKGKPARTPNRWQVARWSRALHRLVYPRRYLLTRGVPPRTPPTYGAATPSYAPTGLAACIVAHESGGNPQAVNGQYHGIAQWSHEAWMRHGGGKYASDPLGASKQQQLIVLSDGISRYGCRDWCPYDGC